MLETIFTNLVEKGSGSVLAVLFAGITVATSGVAAAELYSSVKNSDTPTVAELPTEAEVMADTEVAGEAPASETVSLDESTKPPTSTIKNKLASLLTSTKPSEVPKTNSFPAASPVAKTTNTTTNSTNNQPAVESCIIQLFGKNYNVASLRSSHPGGDVFKCGTDMSQSYQNAHGSNVSRMAAYETTAALDSSVTNSGNNSGTSGQASTSNSGKINSFEHEEEHEDDEYEEEEERHYESEHEEEHEDASHEREDHDD